MKFPPEFSTKVDLTKINWDTMKPWIAKRITELLGGLEDEVLIAYVIEQLEGKKVSRGEWWRGGAHAPAAMVVRGACRGRSRVQAVRWRNDSCCIGRKPSRADIRLLVPVPALRATRPAMILPLPSASPNRPPLLPAPSALHAK